MSNSTARDEQAPLLPSAKASTWTPPFGLSLAAYGNVLLLCSSFAFGLTALCAHILGSPQFGIGLSPIFLVWGRCLFQTVVALSGLYFFIPASDILPAPSFSLFWLLGARGVCGATAFLFFYSALTLLPLGDVLTLFFLSPLLTMLLCSVVFREPITKVEALAALVSFVGVALLGWQEGGKIAGLDGSGRSRGVFLALSAALFSSFAYCCIRKLGTGVHPLTSVTSIGLCGTLLTSVLARDMLAAQVRIMMSNSVAFAVIVASCVVGFVGQCCLTAGMTHARGFGVMICNVEVPISFALGVLVLGEVPTAASCVGALLVLVASSAVTLSKAPEAAASDDAQ